MASYRRVINSTTSATVLEHGKWCASYWCHLKGLQFQRSLAPTEGLIFVRKGMSVVSTTIHMFFCFFPIGVVWLDRDLKVVDAKLAKPWRPSYAPQSPAQYYIEANTHILDRVSMGDQLQFEIVE